MGRGEEGGKRGRGKGGREGGEGKGKSEIRLLEVWEGFDIMVRMTELHLIQCISAMLSKTPIPPQ